MKKTIGKSIFAAIAIGLLSISYASADTVDQSVSTNHSEAASNSKNVTHKINNASAIIQKPRAQLVGWPLMTQDSARNVKGVVEATAKLPYEAEAPSYIPFGYQLYTARHDRNDVLEVVYHKRNAPIYQAGKKFITNVMAYRMGYSVDTVRDTAYIPAEYKDYEWSEQGESGKVYYTGKPGVQLIRSITWTEGGMVYSLFFLDPVKAADAEFYKEHIVPVKTIDSSRYELLGNYPVTKTSAKTLKLGHNFKNVEPRMDGLQWRFHDWPIENTQKAHTFKGNLKEAAKKLPYEVKAPSYIPYGYEIYTVRQDKNDVLEVVYFIKNSQTYRVGKRNSGSIFVYRMGYSVNDVKDVPYVPGEYKDFEWSEQGESGEVFYTGDPAVQLIRSITWTKDGMAYSLLFLEAVKAVDAEFYKEHVEPVKI